ncbi:hypothetical protein A4R26_29240 [Niastella populi]|uniref:Peptidoglycan binding-like domain-containing protein n=1 Tax=Niastella populi TaxID=550983 RepID=A0A1V9F0S5_9BACT|nr:hypothetical protein A4R26_29240 [Niastella populi]
MVSSKQSTSAVPYRTLDVGCEGKDVEALQVLLGKLKYDVFPSGYYTQKTRLAVLQYQKDNKLTADGKVYISTYKMIQRKVSASTFPNRVLEVGCEGKDVDSVQVLLRKLKYDVYPTGYFTEMTKQAVVQFQKDNQLTQDGKVDVRTFELIQKKYNELRFK